MPDTTTALPLAVEPDYKQRRQIALAQRESDPTFKELGTAALLQGPVAAGFNYLARDPLFWESDPSFSLSPGDDLWKSLTDGVDPAYWPQFADAVSTQHAFYIRNLAENKQRYRDQLSAAGASGVAASTIASIVDPVYLAAGIASGGLGVLAGGSRLAQLTRAGLIGGASFAGIESFKAHEDPVISNEEVALAGASGLLGTAAGLGASHLGRGARFAIGGAAQAAPVAAFDALSDHDSRDVMLNILPQFLLGGVMSALGPRTRDHAVKVDKTVRNTIKEMEREIVNEAGVTLTPKGEAYFRPIDSLTEIEKFKLAIGEWSPFEQALGIDHKNPEKLTVTVPADGAPQNFADLLREPKSDFQKLLDGEPTVPGTKQIEIDAPVRQSELTFDDLQRIIAQVEREILTPIGQDSGGEPARVPGVAYDATISESGPSGAVGAASPNDPAFAVRRVEKINEQPGDLNLNNIDDDPASFRRFDAAGMTSRSDHYDIRRAANMLGIDHVPKQRSGMVHYTAPDAAESWHAANAAELHKANTAAYDAYAKSTRDAGGEPMKTMEFFEAAADAYESGRPSPNPHIDAVVQNVRRIRKADWERMQRHGVVGVDGEFDPFVLDRYTDRVQLDEFINQSGYEQALDDIIERVQRHPGNAELVKDPVATRAVAKAWLDNAARQHDRVSIAAPHTLDADSVAIYAAKLREAVPTLTEQQINDIVWKTGPDKGDSTTPSKLRRQVRLDSAWENPALKGFKLNSVLLRNIEEVERMNSRYVNGRSAMAEVYRQFSTTDRKVETLAGLVDLLRERAVNTGANADQIKSDLARIEFMGKKVLGIPDHASTTFTRLSRIARNASFARVINTATGIRNFTELASAVAENGLTAFTKQITPALGDFFEKVRTGKVDNQATRDMHQLGIGVGELSHRTLPTPEEGEFVPKANTFEHRLDKGLRVADRATQRLANMTSTLSLIGPGQVALERTVFRLVSQRWLDIANGSTSLPSEARLKAMGLTPEMTDRIVAQIKKPGAVAYDKSGAGDIWAGWNFDKWDDIPAATAFRQAMYKTNRRQVYRPTPSELSTWMSGDVAKVFTQLRTFMLGSYASKTLFNAKMGDQTAIISMGAQLVSKAIAYAGITYLYSLGQPDPEKYRRDRMEHGKIARAAISGAEFTSIVPMGVDVVQAFRGRQPYFAFARTTGLGDSPGLTGLVTSNPTADTIDKVARAVGVPVDKLMGFFEYQAGLSRSFDPRITDRDVKNIKGGLPWQRMLGIDQFFRHVVESAPRERR